MEMGEKIRQLRQAAGLSQRQLCGERITRNMLSQIEHGTARPSMETLQYLAARLDKPVSWFLDEQTVTSPNLECLVRAREAWRQGDGAAVQRALERYQGPDGIFDEEAKLLDRLGRLLRARTALEEGRGPYAAQLLAGEAWEEGYCAPQLEAQRRSLLVQAGETCELPGLDVALILRAGQAIGANQPERAARLLDAVEDRGDPKWNLLRGRCHLAAEEWADGAACLRRAEAVFPREVAPLMEVCCRHMGDYKGAYEYACKQR